MALTEYPASPVASLPVDLAVQWKTTTTPMESGTNEQRTQRWRFGRRSVTLKYDILSAAEIATLWAFYMARKGSYEAFWFYLPVPATEAYTDEFVARGTGAVTSFDLPGKSTSGRTIYVDGAAESNVTFATGTGEASADRVTFTGGAPALGALITCDFTGYLRLRMRYALDKLARTRFEALFYSIGVDLIEARVE